MRKALLTISGAALATFGASAANADVTCTPGNCVVSGTATTAPKASFIVTPAGVGPDYRGSISASIGNTIQTVGSFSDTFSFMLPVDGFGGGSVTTVAASFEGVTDLDFTSVLINGAAATIQKTANGIVEMAFGSDVPLTQGVNTIVVNGISRGNGSYGGSISFTPTVPELATWGMMILGFAGIGGAMRYRRKSFKIAFA